MKTLVHLTSCSSSSSSSSSSNSLKTLNQISINSSDLDQKLLLNIVSVTKLHILLKNEPLDTSTYRELKLPCALI